MLTRRDLAAVLQPYVPSIFQILNTIALDANRSEALMRASMGVIGLVADITSLGEIRELLT
jgi:importin subunit beta-1